jgi:hypothetical protein
MTGPYRGRYVGGIPTTVARDVVDALTCGELVPVHVMHRHRSGNYESSDLCLKGGRLVMVFKDREELA